MSSTPAARARFRERHHTINTLSAIGNDHLLKVPADIVRVEVHVPCFGCGAAGGCRHRPWMLRGDDR